MLQAARRVGDGQLPYRDFLWPYGPGQPYLLAGLFELTDVSLLSWRIVRVAVDGLVAVVVFALVRGAASLPLALVAWLTAACAMAQPASANPFPIALLLSLLAVAGATGRLPPGRAAVLAGALTGLAGFWRLDFALYAAVGVTIGLALRPEAKRLRRLALYGGVSAGVALALYSPFLIELGPGSLYDALAGDSLRDGDHWRLPFPLRFEEPLRLWPPATLAEDAKDALGFYVPLLMVAGLVVAAAGLAPGLRGRPRAAALLGFAAGCLAYLLSRTDEFHVTPLLVTLAALLPVVAAGSSGARRALRPVAAVTLGLLLLHGAANRVSALVLPRERAPLELEVADGVRAEPAEARALARIVALVRERAAPQEPIYVVTRRSDLVRFSNPLIYVLADRDNPTPRDFGVLTSAPDQAAIVRALERARPPVVVRWTDPISAQREPNLRGVPSGSRLLDVHLAMHYKLLERAGYYDVLVPRRPEPRSVSRREVTRPGG